MRRLAIVVGLLIASAAFAMGADASSKPQPTVVDVCVYGGTSGGVMAAVQTARQGKSVILIEPGQHLGGMTAAGLGAVDIGNPQAVGGLAREYFTRLTKGYGIELSWRGGPESGSGGTRGTGGKFATEPSAAERLFEEMIREAGVRVLRDGRLKSVIHHGATIEELQLEHGTPVRAKMFIDATYEGDLLAAAKISCIVGRESNATYGETVNGIQAPARSPRAGKFEVFVDPFRIPGNPGSGFIPLIQNEPYGKPGTADGRIQSYNYRLCLTDVPANRRPIEAPPGYREDHFELLARWIEARVVAGQQLSLADFCKFDRLPHGKYDFNNRWPISTDMIGGSEGYPQAGLAERKRIERAHEDYLRGFFYFLAHSSRVPVAVRQEMQQFGLARDEFISTDNWPHQIYVREARRMVSDFVMVEQHCTGEIKAPQSIGLGAYGIDLHAVRRIVDGGKVFNEGSNGRGVPHPYAIAYGAVVPKSSECQNLLVPFCLSASHVAFGSIRMEPVFMVLAQSCASAACQAIDLALPVQQIDYDKLRERLLADGQRLTWPPINDPLPTRQH